ncbi:MAG: hypothetical protein R2746_04435 [Acidimicrobiales bacterium]
MDSFGYKLFFLLHILSVIVAFAPAFVWPVVSVNLKKQGKEVGPAIGALAAGNTTKARPGAGARRVLRLRPDRDVRQGLGVQPVVDPQAMLLWFIMIGVLFGVMLPAEKKAAAGDAAADKIASMAGGILHLLLLLMLIDMIWKPGL